MWRARRKRAASAFGARGPASACKPRAAARRSLLPSEAAIVDILPSPPNRFANPGRSWCRKRSRIFSQKLQIGAAPHLPHTATGEAARGHVLLKPAVFLPH